MKYWRCIYLQRRTSSVQVVLKSTGEIVWLPRSVVDSHGIRRVGIPEWLAEEKRL